MTGTDFDATLRDVIDERNPHCWICESVDRAAIEKAILAGARGIDIGIAMQRLGQVPSSVTPETAGSKVRDHRRRHMERDA